MTVGPKFFCGAGIESPGSGHPTAKRPSQRREPFPEPPPLPLPIPFEAYGQPGTFNFRSYDGRTVGFKHEYTARHTD